MVEEKAAELELANSRFTAALHNMSQGLCLFDPDQRVVVANARYAEIYRLHEDQIKPGTSLREILQAREASGTGFATDPEAYVSVNVKQAAEIQELADGRVISIKRQPMSNGGWLTTHEDVTAEKHSEKLLAEKAAELEVMNTRFSTALDNMAQGLCMFDGEKRLTVWNDRYVELLSMPAHLLKVGTPLREIIGYRVSRDMRRTIDDPAVKLRVTELLMLAPDASRTDELSDGKFVMLTRRPMAGGGWVTMIEDITERRRAEAEIVHLARHDVLTGLANRAEFNARLEEASRRLKRNGGSVTVMMIDLDRFKAVNDTLGHLAGDQLLSEVAHRLQSAVRDIDVLARLGGDEFAIIQEGGVDQREGAVALALRIIEAIAVPFDLNGTASGSRHLDRDCAGAGKRRRAGRIAQARRPRALQRQNERPQRLLPVPQRNARDRQHPAIGRARIARGDRARPVRAALPAGGGREDRASFAASSRWSAGGIRPRA